MINARVFSPPENIRKLGFPDVFFLRSDKHRIAFMAPFLYNTWLDTNWKTISPYEY